MTHLFAPDLFAAEPVPAPAQPFGPVELRPLASPEALAAHLKRLDERGRRMRFGSPVNDGFIDSYARRQSPQRAALTGLFVAGTLRGVAELCFDPTDPAGAEGAFSLERSYRGRGLGTRLFEALIVEARQRGIASLTLQCLRENVAMQRIARRFAADLSFEKSEVTARIAVRPVARGGRPLSLARFLPVLSSLQPA